MITVPGSPSSRYRLSPVAFPESLPPIEYLPGDTVRVVTPSGMISLGSRFHPVGRAFGREPVALRPTARDGIFDVYHCHERIRRLDLRRPTHTKWRRRPRAPEGAASGPSGAGQRGPEV